MTREEAIDILEWGRPREWDSDKDIKDFDEALGMAKEALMKEVHSAKGDVKKLPYSDYPKPLTVTMELSSADVMVLEEISGEKIETEEQAAHALKVAMVLAD